MKRTLIRLTILAMVWLASTSQGADANRLITPQDLWAMKRLGSPSVSPDGKTVERIS